MNDEIRDLLKRLKEARQESNGGYVVDNLGLRTEMVNTIKADPRFAGKSIHYAIQQIINQHYA